jgi:hypothetical protein
MNLNLTLSPIDTNGRLVDDLARLLQLFGINPSLPLESLQKLTAARWITKDHERWEEPETTLRTRSERAAFWRAVGNLPLYHEIWPTPTSFDHVLVLGGTLLPQDRKNELVVRLWEQGVDFGNIVHMGGDRQLNDKLDGTHLYGIQHPGGLPVTQSWSGIIGEHPQTEADMLYQLWHRSQIPSEMRMIPTHFVGASLTTGFRANTGDTYVQWLETNPTPGKALIVSISPHGPYQYWGAVHALRASGFEIHLAAPSAALGPQRMSYFTGAIPRWLGSYLRATCE